MALADIPPAGPPRRLDSWKEIADYLGRDVRTATRWESQGLPVHRIPGGKGRSVFALSNEVDAWMAGNPAEVAGEDRPRAAESLPPPPGLGARAAILLAASALTISLAAMVFVLRGSATTADSATLNITTTPSGISLASGSGEPRTIYRFQPDAAVLIHHGPPARITDLKSGDGAGIVAGVSFFIDTAGNMTRGGELLNLSVDGAVRWRFAFDDVLTFRDAAARGPWAMTAWEASAGAPRARIAVAAHDYVWWASMVAVIDDMGHRHGTFVNPGWIESVLWLGPNRLAAAGFNNPRNEAALVLIDPDAADGQAPGGAATAFACVDCPSASPLFYATFPRSELNLATGSPFNRAEVVQVGDRILVTTSETGQSTATAIYEFDRELRFVRARYSEAYWDEHGRLERAGRLKHTRQTCPERDGPPAIHVWDAAAGRWRPVAAVPVI